jgi:putative glycosyltransferase (TIGR04348 family)
VFSGEATALTVVGKRILIASPATARENNGNWQTASRWAHFLQPPYEVEVAPSWPGTPAPDLMVALHARRSAPALAAFTEACPERPSVLVLTGTDLYRDIDSAPEAQTALEQAHALVLLQPAGLERLPAHLLPKAHVIYQSAPPLEDQAPRPRSQPEICMVGHLRAEKDPLTFIRAARLANCPGARFVHIGGALDPGLGAAAEAAQHDNPRYRWLGPLDHDAAREQIRRSHAMVIASRMEGGANVIIEAVTCGVPVLASNISGNRGMLGDDYAGYFALGDAPALARLVERSVREPDFYALLLRQCAARAPLFHPAAEQALLRDLVDNLLLRPAQPMNQTYGPQE